MSRANRLYDSRCFDQNTVLRQIFHTSGSPPYGAPLILDEVLGELLDLRGKPVRGPNVDVEVPDTSTKRSAATEAFGSCYPTAQQTKAPESSVPKSVAVSDILTELKQKSTQLRERERRVANEMETVIHLLKKHESPNFKAMSERIYAEPWRRPRCTLRCLVFSSLCSKKKNLFWSQHPIKIQIVLLLLRLPARDAPLLSVKHLRNFVAPCEK